MGVEKEFSPVKLFSGFIYGDEDIYREVKKRLAGIFSPVDLESDVFNFDFTTYYNQEMGTPLFRRFVSFKEFILPEQLPDIKLLTNKIEIETACDGKRTINLDPGYLSEANVIIATTKNYYHRVPLQKGIYAHMEYVIKGKKICPLAWTYPDFKTEGYLDFFQRLRLLYKKEMKEIREKGKAKDR
ncbi:MAG: DUF4416 family protein [Candidatus Aminicenantes bacterium]|nr:MAG: DUF4416 family protein [Candidatus Aminicenantes bacterium]